MLFRLADHDPHVVAIHRIGPDTCPPNLRSAVRGCCNNMTDPTVMKVNRKRAYQPTDDVISCQAHHVLPRISQETLAEMIGAPPSRVNVFMNKFKQLGFIGYNGGLKVNHSLLTVIVDD